MPAENSPLYEITAEMLDGQRLKLSYFAGRVLLVVRPPSDVYRRCSPNSLRIFWMRGPLVFTWFLSVM